MLKLIVLTDLADDLRAALAIAASSTKGLWLFCFYLSCIDGRQSLSSTSCDCSVSSDSAVG